MDTRPCQGCREPFRPVHRVRQRYCSKECRLKRNKTVAKAELVEKSKKKFTGICANCGTPYPISEIQRQRYARGSTPACSYKCRNINSAKMATDTTRTKRAVGKRRAWERLGPGQRADHGKKVAAARRANAIEIRKNMEIFCGVCGTLVPLDSLAKICSKRCWGKETYRHTRAKRLAAGIKPGRGVRIIITEEKLLAASRMLSTGDSARKVAAFLGYHEHVGLKRVLRHRIGEGEFARLFPGLLESRVRGVWKSELTQAELKTAVDAYNNRVSIVAIAKQLRRLKAIVSRALRNVDPGWFEATKLKNQCRVAAENLVRGRRRGAVDLRDRRRAPRVIFTEEKLLAASRMAAAGAAKVDVAALLGYSRDADITRCLIARLGADRYAELFPQFPAGVGRPGRPTGRLSSTLTQEEVRFAVDAYNRHMPIATIAKELGRYPLLVRRSLVAFDAGWFAKTKLRNQLNVVADLAKRNKRPDELLSSELTRSDLEFIDGDADRESLVREARKRKPDVVAMARRMRLPRIEVSRWIKRYRKKYGIGQKTA